MSESHPPISLRPEAPEAEPERVHDGKASTKRIAKGKPRAATASGGDTSPRTPATAEGEPPLHESMERTSSAPSVDRLSDRPSEPIELSADRRRASKGAQNGEPQRSEETAPFLLERSSPDVTEAAAGAVASSAVAASASSASASGHVRLLRMARRLGVLVLLNALLYASIAVGGALRYAGDRTAIPEVVAAIVALGLTIWGTLSGYHLFRASGGKPNAGHQLAGAFANLRSIFILKGTGLFLVLALSCFAFSAVLSLFALL